jgi:hypothetical protein
MPNGSDATPSLDEAIAIPDISDEPAPPCPGSTPSDYFQFLDDTCDAKRFPSNTMRTLACPTVDQSATVALTGGGEVAYLPSGSEPDFDTEALDGIVPDSLQIVVILIRRVDGVPHYRYLSHGDPYQAFQPWSTTKFLAAANAAASIRIASNYQVGLDASESASNIPLGDLVSSIHAYDAAPYSSNGLGRYFHNIGGRTRANSLIHAAWLDRPATESFGGNYGEASPPLGYRFTQPGGQAVELVPDTSPGPANHLSAYTLAESLKRLVLHLEEPDQRLPGIQGADIKTLLYGAESSQTYGPWGGMSADTAIYLQSGHDPDYIEERSQGQWRIFSKLGLGTSGQFLNVGYACLPVLDPSGQPVPNWGREFVIAAHLPTGASSWAERDHMLARAYRGIVKRIVDGRL